MKNLSSIFIICLLVHLTSCSLIKSKEDYLVNGQWLLQTKATTLLPSGKGETYGFKVSDAEFFLTFNDDGTYFQKQNVQSNVGRWIIKDDYLIFGGREKIKYHIIDLNSKELSLSFSSDDYSLLTVLIFLHPDDPDWPSDLVIEMMNSERK